ncbi:ABC transporter substrate-binding protein [Marinobacterium aestuariivivens]|uniref:ABC transporter substrate-binding protein n=1 Tax=Marinobacterium aestuariivivens TaxID=1698799 RepID=A0ABW1ZXE8_9GAMM
MIKTLKKAAVVLAASLAVQGAVAADKLTYLFPAPDTLPAFAPFQIAKHKGYYADEGLDVSFQIGKGGADVAKQVAIGNADMGGGIGDTPIVTRANGLKVKGVALLGGQALTQIAVRRDAGVKSMADLRGKAIGVLSYKDTTYYNLLAVLASAGLSQSDASVQALGPGGIIKLMISGDIQAMSGVPEWVAAVQGAGIEVDVFNINDIFPAMAQAMLASDDTIAKRPEAVQGFVKATLKAVREIRPTRSRRPPTTSPRCRTTPARKPRSPTSWAATAAWSIRPLRRSSLASSMRHVSRRYRTSTCRTKSCAGPYRSRKPLPTSS